MGRCRAEEVHRHVGRAWQSGRKRSEAIGEAIGEAISATVWQSEKQSEKQSAVPCGNRRSNQRSNQRCRVAIGEAISGTVWSSSRCESHRSMLATSAGAIRCGTHSNCAEASRHLHASARGGAPQLVGRVPVGWWPDGGRIAVSGRMAVGWQSAVGGGGGEHQASGVMGRYGRYGEIWGDMGRYGDHQASGASSAVRPSSSATKAKTLGLTIVSLASR